MALGVMFVSRSRPPPRSIHTSTNSRNAGYSKGKYTRWPWPSRAQQRDGRAQPADQTTPSSPRRCRRTSNPARRRGATTTAGGYVLWCGDLDRNAAAWTVRSTGYVRNPNNAARSAEAERVRRRHADGLAAGQHRPGTTSLEEPGLPCDMTLSNNLSGSSRLYVAGNLCLSQNAVVGSSELIATATWPREQRGGRRGDDLDTRVQTHVGGQCRYKAAPGRAVLR